MHGVTEGRLKKFKLWVQKASAVGTSRDVVLNPSDFEDGIDDGDIIAVHIIAPEQDHDEDQYAPHCLLQYTANECARFFRIQFTSFCF